ncbi:MAG: DUF1707 domain-containing protein [Actinocatenispora sp.]
MADSQGPDFSGDKRSGGARSGDERSGGTHSGGDRIGAHHEAEMRRLRASDTDRERVAQVLHTAAGEGRLTLDELQDRLDTVYSARTYGELEPVLADLPGVADGTVVPTSGNRPARHPRIDTDADQAEETRVVVGVMSGPTRRGNWLVPKTQITVAFLGGVVLDLRDARFAAAEVTIQAYAVMGGVEIIVPDDLDVRVDGFGFMGGFDDTASGPGDGHGPRVRIKGFAFWGGVDVKRRPRRRHRDD